MKHIASHIFIDKLYKQTINHVGLTHLLQVIEKHKIKETFNLSIQSFESDL